MQSFFGHFLVSEFFNSHGMLQQQSVNQARNVDAIQPNDEATPLTKGRPSLRRECRRSWSETNSSG
jgi:hypothetical protein